MDLYTLTLPLDASAGATLRGWLTSVLESNPLASASSHEIIQAAAEAVNNAIRHSAPQGTTVVVTISIVGRDVYVRVTDRERPPGHREPGRTDEGVEPEEAESLGLTLMHGLMDEVDLHHTAEGTTVRLVKRLRLPLSNDAPANGRDLGALFSSNPAI